MIPRQGFDVRVDRHESAIERRILELCKARKIRVERRGEAWHLEGPGVDIRTTSLALIRESELRRPFGVGRET